MRVYDKVQEEIERRISDIHQQQHMDGTWRFCFEGSTLTDCHMILLLKLLGLEKDMGPFIKRIESLQTDEGTWKLYQDEPIGNLSATINGYVALLASEKYKISDMNMKKAEVFIREQGGISHAHFMTKFILALHGQYKYPSIFDFPDPTIFLARDVPLSIFELSSTARIHLIPMIVCMRKNFILPEKIIPNLNHLIMGDKMPWFHTKNYSYPERILKNIKNILYILLSHNKLYKVAEKFMLERIEKNGTLYSYASATFYMIYALLALGYPINSPLISNAVRGLKTYIWNMDKGVHLQNSPSEIWDTALLSYSLQEANISQDNEILKKATSYLLMKQHKNKRDWSIHAPAIEAGGWGFSESNTTIPDIDDTTAVLRVLSKNTDNSMEVKNAWINGVKWVKGLQNIDGGWGAMEKGVTNQIFTQLPLDNVQDIIIDSSTADLTGRTLEFFGNYAPGILEENQKNSAIDWLIQNQETNGSWYGQWGVCYIYGTWAAITGLRAVELQTNHLTLKKAINWLEYIQNPDGGWGESCQSSKDRKFIPLPFSTPSQTAWALDALISYYETETPVIRNGISYLLTYPYKNKKYPTGIGLSGTFYINYHSYHHIFPLLTLVHYMKKYGSHKFSQVLS